MTDAQDILSGRLAQAQGILNSLLIDEQHANMVSRELNNTLWAIGTLLEQATDAFQEMSQQSKPQDTVTFDTGGIDVTVNFRKESLLVVQEMVKYIDHASCVGQGLLDAVERQDKPAANEAPGGES